MDKAFSESHVRELFGKKQNELVAVESDSKIRALNSENASGPCRARTVDPRIKSPLASFPHLPYCLFGSLAHAGD